MLGLILFSLFISSDPVELLYLFSDWVEVGFYWAILSELPVGRRLGDDVVDLRPAVGLFLIDDDKGLSSSVGSGSPSSSMHVGVSVDWDSHLYDVSYVKIKTSGCHIGGD